MSAGKREQRREFDPRRPLREMEDIRRRFEEDFARPFIRNVWDRISYEARDYNPPTDVYEKDDALVIKVDLPGMKYEEIDVSISEDALVIKGERKLDSNLEEDDCLQGEIIYGGFYRALVLGPDIDTKKIEAVYEDGVLRITLKKAPKAKAQKIEIKVKTTKAKKEEA